MKKFSIVTINLNNKQGLEATHSSIKKQCYDKKYIQWIIIDGLSTDNSLELIYNSPLKPLIIIEKDSGIYDAMNKAKNIITGDYVIYLNSGDIFYDNYSLKKTSNFLIQCDKNPDVVLGDYALKLPNNKIISKKARLVEYYIWHGMPTNHQAIFFSKSCIENNSYNIKYKICGDYDFLVQLWLKNYTFENSHINMALFSTGGISTQKPAKLIKESYEIKKSLKLPIYIKYISAIKSIISIYGLKIISL